MARGLFYQAISKYILGVVVIGTLIFLPAGTFYYWNAWLLIGILFIPMFFAGISWIAAAVFLLSYLLYAEVLRENTYLSRTVEIQQGQRVIDTGLYGIVRYPMYSVTIILFLSMPLVLGSILSFVVFLAYSIIVAKRIRNEETVLEKGLEGYTEYKKTVKYKIIPFVW